MLELGSMPVVTTMGQGGGWRGGHRQRYIGLSGGGRQKQDKQAPTSAAISNLTADPRLHHTLLSEGNL